MEEAGPPITESAIWYPHVSTVTQKGHKTLALAFFRVLAALAVAVCSLSARCF